MNNRDILFLYIGNADEDDRVELPLGVAFLCGQLEKEEFTYDFIDLYTSNNIEKLFSYLEDNIPAFIGISSSSYYLKECSELIDNINNFYSKDNDSFKDVINVDNIKNELTKTPIIIIGGYISLVTDILKKTNADILVHGEGELTLVKIIKTILEYRKHSHDTKLNRKADIEQIENIDSRLFEELIEIPGIEFNYTNIINKLDLKNSHKASTTEHNDNIFQSNHPYVPISDLSSLEFPDYGIFDLNKYRKSQKVSVGKIDSLPFYSQRGCYNSCTFCDIVPFYSCQYVRRMDPERILEWIRSVQQEYGITRVDFMDDNFLNYRPFLEQFFSLLEESVKSGKIKPVKINFQARSNEVIRFKSLLAAYKSYINCIELGTESFAQSQLDRWKKHISSLQNVQAIEILSELDIPYINFYLWFDEKTTIDEIDENIEKLLALPSVRVVGTEINVPNFILNYEISAIYDRLGNSSVNDILPLKYAEEFLNETNEMAKKLSLAYIGMKKTMYNYKSANSLYSENSMNETFFPLIERQMKQRLFYTISIVEKGMSYKNKGRIPVFGTYFKKKVAEFYNFYLNKFITEAERIIAPLEENLGLDFSKFSGF